ASSWNVTIWVGSVLWALATPALNGTAASQSATPSVSTLAETAVMSPLRATVTAVPPTMGSLRMTCDGDRWLRRSQGTSSLTMPVQDRCLERQPPRAPCIVMINRSGAPARGTADGQPGTIGARQDCPEVTTVASIERSVEQMRARRGNKWRKYPSDVLPAWVA